MAGAICKVMVTGHIGLQFCYTEVAVKSTASNKCFPFGGAVVAGLLAAILAGCGTEIISYNRQFREQGLAQYQQASYADAASSFENAVHQEPGDYTSRYYLGQCFEKLGKPQRAIEQYRTCLEVMVKSLEGKGDREMRRKVIEAYAGAISREPDKSEDLTALEKQTRTAENAFILAKIYRDSGDADMAITRFEQAQQIDPQDPQIAKEYGLYLEQLGQTQRADRQLRRAYTLNTRDEEVAAALRRLGIVPGPSLMKADELEKPALPLGPLPEVDLSTSNRKTSPAQPAAPTNSGTVGSSVSPRD